MVVEYPESVDPASLKYFTGVQYVYHLLVIVALSMSGRFVSRMLAGFLFGWFGRSCWWVSQVLLHLRWKHDEFFVLRGWEEPFQLWIVENVESSEPILDIEASCPHGMVVIEQIPGGLMIENAIYFDISVLGKVQPAPKFIHICKLLEVLRIIQRNKSHSSLPWVAEPT